MSNYIIPENKYIIPEENEIFYTFVNTKKDILDLVNKYIEDNCVEFKKEKMKSKMKLKLDGLFKGVMNVAPQKTNSHNPKNDHYVINDEKYSYSSTGGGGGESNTNSYSGNILAKEKKYK